MWRAQLLKVKKAIEAGNIEVARIHGQNSIRLRNTANNCELWPPRSAARLRATTDAAPRSHRSPARQICGFHRGSTP